MSAKVPSLKATVSTIPDADIEYGFTAMHWRDTSSGKHDKDYGDRRPEPRLVSDSTRAEPLLRYDTEADDSQQT